MQWCCLARERIVKTGEETGERLFLVGAQFKFGVQVVCQGGWDFLLQKSQLGSRIKVLIQEFSGHDGVSVYPCQSQFDK